MLEQNYLYKKSKTLKNKYGIKNPQKLYERCAHEAARAAVNFRNEPLPKKFDAAYLQLIHWNLFHKSFEWAGQTREKSFTFADGSTARMPAMRPKGHKVPFAIGSQIQKELKQLERSLTAKNNLQDLSRQEFATEAAEVFIALNHAHPFRKGNGRAQRMFIEKLGQAAGHPIDFSFITKERLTQASIEAMQNGNKQPMKDLFEDITHPQKALILKEFISQMRNAGLDEINNRVVVAVKEGVTYNGIYRGSSAEGFVIEVDGAFVVGHKDDLSPEQVKTFQNGTLISFQKNNVRNLKEPLIPKETLAPLSNEELFKRIKHDPFVEACRKKVEHLSKRVYGNLQALSTKMDIINADPSLGKQFADQMTKNPKSICKLAGSKIFSIRTPSRKHAEKSVPQLCETFKSYITTVQKTKEEILAQHKREQNRLNHSVEKPTRDLQNLFSLSPEQQREALSHSPALRQEQHIYRRQLHNRLSPDERKAIQENDSIRLSCMLGVSESKAKDIAQIMQHTQKVQCQMRTLKVNRSSPLAFAG